MPPNLHSQFIPETGETHTYVFQPDGTQKMVSIVDGDGKDITGALVNKSPTEIATAKPRPR